MANPANRLPPDFDDMHPRDYDPEFTANINTKMRVPDRIWLDDEEPAVRDPADYSTQTAHVRRSMNVPERILIAGQEETVGLPEDPLRVMDPTVANTANVPDYVSLSTPPRSLKLEDNIYAEPSEQTQDQKMVQRQGPHNGYVAGPMSHVSYEGGDQQLAVADKDKYRMDLDTLATPRGGLLLQDSDEDDVTVFKREVLKLKRQVILLQQENEKRSQREFLLYPVIISYVIFQVARWFLRSN